MKEFLRYICLFFTLFIFYNSIDSQEQFVLARKNYVIKLEKQIALPKNVFLVSGGLKQRDGNLALSFDDNLLISSLNKNTVYLLNVVSGFERKLMIPHNFYHALTSEDGSIAALVDELLSGKGATFVDLHNGEIKASIRLKKLLWFSLSRDGKRFANVVDDGNFKLQLWDTTSGKLIAEFEKCGSSSLLNMPLFTKDSRKLLIACEGLKNKPIKVINAEDGREIYSLGNQEEPVYVWLSNDGKTVVSVDSFIRVRVWDTDTGLLRAEVKGSNVEVTKLVFSKDSKFFATAGREVIRLWDTASGRLIREFRSEKWIRQRITDFEISPNGATLVGIDERGNLFVWEIGTGKEIFSLTVKNSDVFQSLNYGFDGEVLYVISSSRIQCIKLESGDTFGEIAITRSTASKEHSSGFWKIGQNGERIVVEDAKGISIWTIVRE